MSDLKNRRIDITADGQTDSVPAHSKVEKTGEFLQVRFTLMANLSVTDIEYITVDNENGYIRMVTSRGNEFKSGAFYDQLLAWFQAILGR